MIMIGRSVSRNDRLRSWCAAWLSANVLLFNPADSQPWSFSLSCSLRWSSSYSTCVVVSRRKTKRQWRGSKSSPKRFWPLWTSYLKRRGMALVPRTTTLDSSVTSLSWRYVVAMSHELPTVEYSSELEAFRLVFHDWFFVHHYGDVGSASSVSTRYILP